MTVYSNTAQDCGKREEQQDAYALCGFSGTHMADIEGWAVIADGMGGMAMGRECAQLAVQAFVYGFEKVIKENNPSIDEALMYGVYSANKAVYGMACENGVGEEAGSTLIAAVVRESQLYWLSVGDSRIYVYSNGSLNQISSDHNLRTRLEKMLQKGLISEDDVQSCHYADAITSFIGVSHLRAVDTHTSPIRLNHGDVVLLCSDGLSNTLSHDTIAGILAQSGVDKAEKLLAETLKRQLTYQDNVTIITLNISNEPMA